MSNDSNDSKAGEVSNQQLIKGVIKEKKRTGSSPALLSESSMHTSEEDEEEEEEEEEEGGEATSSNNYIYSGKGTKNGIRQTVPRNAAAAKVINNEKNKQKNSEASARFRQKRRLRQQRILNAIEIENSKIDEFKVKMKKLQVENDLLKKMVLGPSSPIISSPPSIPQPSHSDSMLNGDFNKSIGNMSNYELLKLLQKD